MSIRHLQGAASDRLSQRHRQTPGTSPGSSRTPPQIIRLGIRRDPRRREELIPQQGTGTITDSGVIHTMKSASPGSQRTPQIIRLRIRRDPRRPRELIPQQGTDMITENGLTQRLTQAV